MSLTSLALRRPLTLIVALVGMLIAACFGLKRMPRDVFPTLGVPTIYVAQPYGGMSPEQMEGFLSYYYEYHFLYITGIEHVESKSIQGASIIKLQFHPGTDMASAMAETVSYVNRARAFMPPGTVPPFVTRFDAGSLPVGNLVFTSDTRSVGEMQDYALNKVRPIFATLPGVSAPPPFGGSARTILINADPDKLRARHLSPDDLVEALSNAETISPAGNIPMGDKYPMVPLNSIVGNIAELARTPIRAGDSPAILIGDVAEIRDGSDTVTSYALVNGRRTVYIPVTKRSDASTLSVVKSVRDNMGKFQAALPDDIRVSYEFDQAPLVEHAIAGVWHEALLGAVFTGLMVMLFLRDWRSVVVVVVNIPLSLLASTLALWLTGGTINLMTLGGLALAVGILVDEATVAVESIHAHLEKGAPVARASLDATRETALPRLLAMLCVIAVFLPSFLMEGSARALFVPLSLAAGFSMFASFLLSSTLVPLASVWLIRPKYAAHSTDESIHGAFARISKKFAGLVRRFVERRRVVLTVYALALAGAFTLVVPRLGMEIFPESGAAQLRIALRAPAGTRVEITEALTLRTLDIIREVAGPDNVKLTMSLVGVHASNYPVNFVYQWNGGPEESVIQVQLRDPVHAALRDRLRERFAHDLPEVSFSFEPSDLVSRVMSFGANTPVEIAVSGSSLADDAAHAEKIRAKLATIPALRDVRFGQSLDYPTLAVKVDRERAGQLGVRMADVSRSLVAATSSSRFTKPVYWADMKTGVALQVQVQIPQERMNSVEQVKNIAVNAPGRDPVALRSLADVTPGTAVGEYERYNMRRLVTITANIENSDLGAVSKEIARVVAEVGAPSAGMSVDTRGQIAPMNTLFDALRDGLLFATVVVFLLLTANFQSPVLSFVVVTSVPAALAGGVTLLLLTGTTLNIQSYMGLIMTVGVAVANAILFVTFAERARRNGATAAEAAIAAAVSRLRPILMTSSAMVAGMIPMAVGFGEGGGQSAPLGRAVVGGVVVATLATLLVLPAMFAACRAKAGRGVSSVHPDDPDSPHASLPVS